MGVYPVISLAAVRQHRDHTPLEYNNNMCSKTIACIRTKLAEMISTLTVDEDVVLRVTGQVESELRKLGQFSSPSNAKMEDIVSQAIKSTDQWIDQQQCVIGDMYSAIHNCLPPPEYIPRLLQLDTPDDIASEIQKLPPLTPHPDYQDEAPPEPHLVDEEWMASFRIAFGREPYVYEYVHIRNMSGYTMDSLAETHATSFSEMQQVYSKYLDSSLSESDFVKRYVPAIYTNADIVQRTMSEALEMPEYRSAMTSRLKSIHEVVTGTPITEVGVDYLFEKDVLGKSLSLDTEVLTEIVAQYIEIGVEITAAIDTLYISFLDRRAETEEVQEWIHSFRIDENAPTLLRESLAGSHEFHSMLVDLIASMWPAKRKSERFSILKRLLDKDLANLGLSQDLENAVVSIGESI